MTYPSELAPDTTAPSNMVTTKIPIRCNLVNIMYILIVIGVLKYSDHQYMAVNNTILLIITHGLRKRNSVHRRCPMS